jgi:hypothetical protein
MQQILHAHAHKITTPQQIRPQLLLPNAAQNLFIALACPLCPPLIEDGVEAIDNT